MKHKKLTEKFQFRLTLNTLILLLIFKGCYSVGSVDHGKIFIYLVSFVQDSFILIANYLIFIQISKMNYRYLRLYANIVFYVSFVLLVTVSFLYTPFIVDMLNFPINIFGVEDDVIAFFFQNFINVQRKSPYLIGHSWSALTGHFLTNCIG